MRIATAAIAGLLFAQAFPADSMWFVAFPSFALLALSVRGTGFWGGTAVGLTFGASFWLTHVDWLTLYLGPIPWAALAGFLALQTGLGVGAATWFARDMARRGAHPAWIAAVWASVWIAREAITTRIPYGGFSWGLASYSQSSGPLLNGASWIGLPTLGWLVAWLSALPVFWWGSHRRGKGMLAIVAVVAVLGCALPPWGAIAQRNAPVLRVAAVQGNANAGLFANTSPGEILQNHLDAAAATNPEDYDVMVWPENSVDLDALANRTAADRIRSFVDDSGKPLLIGSITQRDGQTYNSSILWLPGEGPVYVYDKRRPVPFAEYMPNRELYRPLAPDLIDLIRRDYAFGQVQGNVQVTGADLGILICFEVTEHDLITGLIDHGAQLIVAQSNNADFGRSVESAQQLAITHAQGVAAGRSIVNISTVSSSAVFAPDGSVLDRLPDYQSGAMVVSVPLVNTLAPSKWTGPIGEIAACVIAVGALIRRCVPARFILARWGRS